MAIFRINFKSKALRNDVDVTVMIPENAPKEDIPVLYLLHGMTDDHESWSKNTSIARYAYKRGIAVVCPSGANSYYSDMVYGEKYYTYVSRELVDYMRKIFRFSERREDNYIAGLSMGGYGALRIALMNPHQYCAAAPLSGVLDMASSLERGNWGYTARNIWGEDFEKTVRGSDADIHYLAETFPEDAPKPYIYACCGLSDFLLKDNQRTVSKLRECGFDVDFEEGEGEHNWQFWDSWICRCIDKMFENTGREVK